MRVHFLFFLASANIVEKSVFKLESSLKETEEETEKEERNFHTWMYG